MYQGGKKEKKKRRRRKTHTLHSVSHGLAVSDPVGWVSSGFLFAPSTVSVKAHWSDLDS